MRIQLLSDLHLERRPLTFETIVDTSTCADVLVLAGDIGDPRSSIYRSFLTWCSTHYKRVVVICGNHEYRALMPLSFSEADVHMTQLVGQVSNNVVYLHSGHNVMIDGVNFIGATLWSHIPSSVGANYANIINNGLQGMLVTPGVPFTVHSMNNLFKQHLRQIESTILIGKSKSCKNVVITHHAPILKTMYKVEDYPKNHLYGTDLEQYLKYDIVHTWIYGHTHWNALHNIQGTMLVTNQYGNAQSPCRGWSNSCIFNV